MKKLLLGTILLMFAIVVPIPTMAQININIEIPLPPPIQFAAPPEVTVMPDTDGVYVAPDIDADVYFWNGFWWRLWEGRWYRSSYYDRGWAYYNNVPSFYFDVDPGWRGYYRDHDWHGHPWNYERIPYQRFHQNWRSWQRNRYWEKHGNWGIQGYRPRPQQERQVLRQQRQQEYRQRPEVQQHQQYQQQQRKVQKPQVQQRQQQERQPRVQQRQQEQKKPQVQQGEQHRQPQRSQEKPQKGEEEHRK